MKIRVKIRYLTEQALQTVIYPNPFSERLSVNKQGTFDYQIFSLDGTEIESGSGSGAVEMASKLVPNVYILRIKDGQNVLVQKIIKSE